jgi:rhodanese-related sulfurtransferase
MQTQTMKFSMKTTVYPLLVLVAVSVVFGAAHYFFRGGEAAFESEALAVPVVLKDGEVSLAEVRAIVAERTAGVVLVDARPDLFFEMGHIPGALNVVVGEVGRDFGKNRAVLLSARRVVVYCDGGSCGSAEMVAAELKKLGVKGVGVYVGGWREWEKGNKKEKENKKGKVKNGKPQITRRTQIETGLSQGGCWILEQGSDAGRGRCGRRKVGFG